MIYTIKINDLNRKNDDIKLIFIEIVINLFAILDCQTNYLYEHYNLYFGILKGDHIYGMEKKQISVFYLNSHI